MLKTLKFITTAFIILFLFTTMGCKDEKEPGTVNIYFDHTVEGEALEFDNIKYASDAGHPFSVSRVKYYVSNIELHEEDGTTYPLDVIHYRDAKEETTRTLSMTDIPEGTYDKISFVYGLDELINVDGGLPNTQTNINMEWPIPGDQGYHYMKFEGKYDSLGTGVIKNFNLHTGATMGNQNYIEVSLPLSSFSVDDNTWGIYISMDLNEWLENPNTWDFEEFGPMIMMNQNAQVVLKANGATVFSMDKVDEEKE